MNNDIPYILIVEDDKDMAQLNARLLKRQGYEVRIANTAAEARRELFQEILPDLVVLDIGLPDGSGFSLCEEFRKETDAPVLFLSGKSESKEKVTGFSKGGDYYLTKPYDRNEFLAVVQRLLRKEKQTQKKLAEVSVITRGSLTIKLQDRKAFIRGRDAELTPKEFAVLYLLIKNEGKELSSEYLYESVWGMDMNNSPNALRLHISRIKKKLDEENSLDFAIFTEYGKGYTFTGS